MKFIKFYFSFRLKDQVEMALFVLRYISCLAIFLLGLRAPGIMQNEDYFSLNDSNTGARINIAVS